MAKKKVDPIPEFNSLEEIAEFWNSHSTTDYDNLTHKVQFEIRLHKKSETKSIRLLPEVSATVEAMARLRGVSTETLVNTWLMEKSLESSGKSMAWGTTRISEESFAQEWENEDDAAYDNL